MPEDIIPRDPKHVCILCGEYPVNDDDWKRGERFDGSACEDEWCRVKGSEIGDLYGDTNLPADRVALHEATVRFVKHWQRLRKVQRSAGA